MELQEIPFSEQQKEAVIAIKKIEPFSFMEEHSILYSYDSYTNEEELVEKAVLRTIEKRTIQVPYQDSRSYFQGKIPIKNFGNTFIYLMTGCVIYKPNHHLVTY